MAASIIIFFVANVFFAYAVAYDITFLGIVAVILLLAGSLIGSGKIADYFIDFGSGAKEYSIRKKMERKHNWIIGISLFSLYALFVLLQLSFVRFEQKQIMRYGINVDATVTNVYYKTGKGSSVRFIEYTYTLNGKQYMHECSYRDEALNATLPVRVLPGYPDIHYICLYTLRKPPLHRGRAVSYRRICYPYAPPAVISDKITRAPWAISYHEYGPWDMFMNPVMVVIFPEGDQLKKVTLYHPDFGEDVPTEIAETTITGMQEKLAMTFACKLRSGNFPTEEMYVRKEERKDKLARRRIYHPSRFNFRIYNRGITRDLFYTNLVRYFGVSNKEQVEAAIKLMRTLRDE